MKLLIDNTSFLPIVGGTETYCFQLLSHIKDVDLRLICQVPTEGPSKINRHLIKRVGDHGLKEGYHNGSKEDDLALGMGRLLEDKDEAIQSLQNVRKAGLEAYYSEIEQFKPEIMLVNDLMRIISAPYIQHTLFALDTKIVVNLHGILTSFGMLWDIHPEKKRLAEKLIAREDLPLYFIAPSKYVYDMALEWGIKKNRLKLIYLGIDTDLFHLPTSEEKMKAKKQIFKKFDIPLVEEEILICFPSRAVSHKGVDIALESLELLAQNQPNLKWKLIIAGGSSDNPESIANTQELIDEYHIQDRILVGIDLFLNFPESMRTFHHSCDLCLFPSRREALGYSALESMACGVPVIGTSIPGLSEALGVNPGFSGECSTGWIVPSEDSKALASQLAEVLNNPSKLEPKGKTARKWVESKFSLGKMIYEHKEFFREIYQSR